METTDTLYTNRNRNHAEQIQEDDQVVDESGYNRAFCRQLRSYEIVKV